MVTMFDGRAFAQSKLEDLKIQVRNLSEKGIKPKLVSIIVGDDPASIMYVNLKKKRAEEVGCELLVVSCEKDIKKEELKKTIQQFNNNESVNGVMVQLPLPNNFSDSQRDEIINSIDPNKDVDGLRPDSKFIPPTAEAVLQILSTAEDYVHFKDYPVNIAVIGATGFIGKQIVKALSKWNSYKILELDSKTKDLRLMTKDCDVVIAVTGVPNLIKADMVKDPPSHEAPEGHSGAILIDVGSPQGDIERAAYEKASFVSPVPGGVGPVTISCLLENLIEGMAYNLGN